MDLTDVQWNHAYVKAGDLRFHLVIEGEGPTVLLLHGFPVSWYFWRYQIKALAEAGYRAVAMDLRGYNESDRPLKRRAYHIDHLCGDLSGIIEALGKGPVHLVGHDWGTPANTVWTNDQWMPVLAVKPDGTQLFMAWYDRRNEPNNGLMEVFGRWGTIETNGSVKLDDEFRITPVSFPHVFLGTDTNNLVPGRYDPVYHRQEGRTCIGGTRSGPWMTPARSPRMPGGRTLGNTTGLQSVLSGCRSVGLTTEFSSARR